MIPTGFKVVGVVELIARMRLCMEQLKLRFIINHCSIKILHASSLKSGELFANDPVYIFNVSDCEL